MKKKTTLVLLILLVITGSLVTFYATNLLFSDLSNMFYGAHDIYIISSFPLFFVSLMLVTAFIFVMRFSRYPEYKKATVRLYTVFLLILSLLGIAFSIATGTVIYHSFLAPYPFFIYPLMMLVVCAALFIAGIIILIKNSKAPDDAEKKHFKVKYILYSIMLVFLTYFAFYKFGALLTCPIYAQARTLYLTFPFYLSLLLPLMILIHIVIYFMDGYKGREKSAVRYVFTIFILNFILNIGIYISSRMNTSFTAAVSPALPLERLATFPLDTVMQFVLILIFSVYYLVYSIKTYKLSKK